MINVKDLPAPNDTYPIRRALLSVFDKKQIKKLLFNYDNNEAKEDSTGVDFHIFFFGKCVYV